MLAKDEFQAPRPMDCSPGGIITKTGWALNPGWGTLRRISRPSWQRANGWQKTWVAKSHAVSHCSRCKSSSTKLPQHPHDLSSASQLPCFTWTATEINARKAIYLKGNFNGPKAPWPGINWRGGGDFYNKRNCSVGKISHLKPQLYEKEKGQFQKNGAVMIKRAYNDEIVREMKLPTHN